MIDLFKDNGESLRMHPQDAEAIKLRDSLENEIAAIFNRYVLVHKVRASDVVAAICGAADMARVELSLNRLITKEPPDGTDQEAHE